MDITKALALCAERLQVKPKEAREMLFEIEPPPKPARRSAVRAGGNKSEAERDAANRQIVEKARAQIAHTLRLLG